MSTPKRLDIPVPLLETLREFFLLAPGELRDLLTSRAHAPLFQRQRARIILTRVRVVAALFAVLTPLWIAVDALTFPWALAGRLAAARAVTSFAFGLLAWRCRCLPTLVHARGALAVLFAIPTAFFLFSRLLLSSVALDPVGVALASGYAFLPFIYIAGLAWFPLVLMEHLFFALPWLVALALAMGLDVAVLPGLNTFVALWLLLLIAVVGSAASLSQLQLLKGLLAQSTADPLTRLLNRRSGEELLSLFVAQARRQDYPLTLAFLDVDDFKCINDRYGHEAGDALLAGLATRLREGLRGGDAAMRWGGEEFVVVMPYATAAQAAERIAAIVAGAAVTRPDGRRLTVSAGFSELWADRLTRWEDLVALADRRMYEAKRAGKNRFVGPGDCGPSRAEAAASESPAQ